MASMATVSRWVGGMQVRA